jgi:hypothetical protein
MSASLNAFSSYFFFEMSFLSAGFRQGTNRRKIVPPGEAAS